MSCLLRGTAEITEAFLSRVTWKEQHEVTKDIRNRYHVMWGRGTGEVESFDLFHLCFHFECHRVSSEVSCA